MRDGVGRQVDLEVGGDIGADDLGRAGQDGQLLGERRQVAAQGPPVNRLVPAAKGDVLHRERRFVALICERRGETCEDRVGVLARVRVPERLEE
ncbi:MAG: hypothetical protein ACK56I_04880, partial [bacterium]